MAFSVSVPDALGVPAVNFAPGFGGLLPLLVGDALSLFLGVSVTQQWGIYFFGIPVVLADNVLSFDYKKSAAVSDYPIEGGLTGASFESYNKVQIPADARFRFSTGGSQFDRQAFLESIDLISGDLNTYDIVTPDAIYLGYNVTNYQYRRTAESGAGLLSVDVWTLQVRVAPGISFSTTTSPTDAGLVSDGTVMPTAATGAQAASIPTINGE